MVGDLRCANDIVLSGEALQDITEIKDKLLEACTNYKLRVNTEKTKVMKISRKEEQINMNIQGPS